MNAFPENSEKVVLACIALHNFIISNNIEAKRRYIPQNYVDSEVTNNVVRPGDWRQEVNPLPRMPHLGSNNSSRIAYDIRELLTNYFLNEGAISFQYNRF